MDVQLKGIHALFDTSADALVIGLYEDGQNDNVLRQLSEKMKQDLSSFFEEQELGTYASLTSLFTFGSVPMKQVVFLGLGRKEEQSFDRLRKATGRLVRKLKTESITDIAFYSAHTDQVSSKRFGQAITEAFYLSNYEYKEFFKQDESEARKQLYLFVDDPDNEELQQGLALGKAIGESTVYARNLMNAPANYLTPVALKDEIVKMAGKYGLETNVLNQSQLEELKMGGILGVAQGSVLKPYVVTVKYEGNPLSDEVLGLIGKGVTFDTGGISLKAKPGLELLKKDMGGSASMIGVMETIAKLKPKVNLLLVVGCVENMPSGSAYKPGDVVTMMDGKTVEIISTDAEGRLVLGDCITYAKSLGVTSLIDCATLTGAVRVALGYIAAGVMGNKQEMIDKLLASAKEGGEKAWQLPLYDEYFDPLKSQVAYMKNSGAKFGGASVAGKFIEQFVGDTPWIHLDISSSGYTHEANDLGPVGATGSMISTVTHYVLNHQA
ncbi:leucyl aminopeptidase [Sporosarcina oncorhynchi]|uniref:Probable cytosol aminopeptidase n=1 Tax=Sporosarcina oncorhynchi TaxID=3056444 RepID=A0ABZ0L7I0_9BACL|nr:leucyl aminopeptidase [Sporosarcina sp. T2O-4]WOV88124.1 leucyl aminopeptidase [Sporosarcina sp. T2O-4]